MTLFTLTLRDFEIKMNLFSFLESLNSISRHIRMHSKQRKTDGDLVLDYQSGNKEALVLLVKRHHKLFCEKAFYIIKDVDVAKDIAQDSWNVITSKIDALRNPESFKSWGLRIVYNKSIDWININNKKRIELEAYKNHQDFLDESDAENEDENKQLMHRLLKAIKKLPNHQQVVIRLFYTEDYSLKEISDILNISVGTAKSRLFHAREKLKTILKHKHYEK